MARQKCQSDCKRTQKCQHLCKLTLQLTFQSHKMRHKRFQLEDGSARQSILVDRYQLFILSVKIMGLESGLPPMIKSMSYFIWTVWEEDIKIPGNFPSNLEWVFEQANVWIETWYRINVTNISVVQPNSKPFNTLNIQNCTKSSKISLTHTEYRGSLACLSTSSNGFNINFSGAITRRQETLSSLSAVSGTVLCACWHGVTIWNIYTL